MATNFIKGSVHTTDYTAVGADVASGDVVVLGATTGKRARVGVALVDIPDGKEGTVGITGCWRLPKVTGAVIVQGEGVSWDAGESAVDDNAATGAAGGVTDFGMADAPAGAGVLTADVWIDTPGILT